MHTRVCFVLNPSKIVTLNLTPKFIRRPSHVVTIITHVAACKVGGGVNAEIAAR